MCAVTFVATESISLSFPSVRDDLVWEGWLWWRPVLGAHGLGYDTQAKIGNKKGVIISRVWWRMLLVPALQRQEQEDL